MHFQQLEQDLKKLTNVELENEHSYKTAGISIFDRVYKMIKKYSKYRISRYEVAGSIGKNTSLGVDFQPDFDIVVFVRDVTTPLTPIVEEFYGILKTQLPSNCKEWAIFDPCKMTKNSHTIKFFMITSIATSKGTKKVHIDFDLLPALSYSRNIENQTQTVLWTIRNSPNPWRDWNDYSTSLCEKTIRCIRGQPPFVHSVIRLAKLWDAEMKKELQKNGNDFYFPGRSTVIELIAIHATTLLERKGSLLEAFRRFLVLLEDFDRIHIHFCKYTKVFGKETVPLIVDWVNPYNNYAGKVDETSRRFLKCRAKLTLDSLTALAKAKNQYEYRKNFKIIKLYFVLP